jgi:hypothetical protein
MGLKMSNLSISWPLKLSLAGIAAGGHHHRCDASRATADRLRQGADRSAGVQAERGLGDCTRNISIPVNERGEHSITNPCNSDITRVGEFRAGVSVFTIAKVHEGVLQPQPGPAGGAAFRFGLSRARSLTGTPA